MVNLIDLSKRHLLNETEHRVLEQILDAVEHDTKINIRSVAQQSYVSTTTVIKLSKKLGYQGYSDMIYSLRRHAEEERNAAAGIDLTSILETVDEARIEAFANEILRCQMCIRDRDYAQNDYAVNNHGEIAVGQFTVALAQRARDDRAAARAEHESGRADDHGGGENNIDRGKRQIPHKIGNKKSVDHAVNGSDDHHDDGWKGEAQQLPFTAW